MSKKKKTKKKIQHVSRPDFIAIHWQKIVIILLIALPLIYFAGFLTPNRMLAGSDYLIGGYPMKKWITDQAEMPLWYSHIFGGVPVLGSPVGGPLAPLDQLRIVIPHHVLLVVSFIIFFILAGIGTYLYLKEIGISPYAAALGAVIFQFAGSLATTPNAGHLGRAASIALMPLTLFCVHRALTTKKVLYFIFIALVTALSFYEGHFQITYYALLFIVAYVAYYLIAKRKEHQGKDYIKIFGFGIGSVALIWLLMAAIWLPVLGGLGYGARGVQRGYEYATSWALPPHEIIDLVIPTYSGILNNYWGFNNFKIHMEYFGLVALLLAVFAVILYWKKPYVKFYAIAAFLMFFVALGGHTPVFRLFYSLIPGFRLMRAHALIFFVIAFCFVVLGSIGFDRMVIHPDEKERSSLKKALYVIGGIMLGALVLLGLIMLISKDSVLNAMQQSLRTRFAAEWGAQAAESKLAILRTNFPRFIEGIWRSTLVIGALLGVVLIALRTRTKASVLAVIAIAIALVDQLPLMAKFLPSEKTPEIVYAADNAINAIKKDKGVFRVFPTPWYEHVRDSYLLYHGLQSAGGYIANPLLRYQEFIGAGRSVMFQPTNLVQHDKFLDMLNIKYLIGPTLPEEISGYNPQDQMAIRRLQALFSRYIPVSRAQRYTVYRNDHALPRAYLVFNYLVMEDTVMISYMKTSDFEPRHVVLLEKEPGFTLGGSEYPLIAATITKYTPNEITCETESTDPGILVLTDNWHPDWKVFVDGNAEEMLRANYVFRAVFVPAGTHQITFTYISDNFNVGVIITIIALLLSAGYCLVYFVRRRFSVKK